MPLTKSKSEKAFKHNIKAEIAAGKPQKQAVAIAYDVKRRAKKADGGIFRDDNYETSSQLPTKPLISEKRKNENFRKGRAATVMEIAAKTPEEKKKIRDRADRRSVSETTRIMSKLVSNPEEQRKKWSEKVGEGKPAPFKKGGKVCW